MNVQRFLQQHNVWFERVEHERTLTAQTMAHAIHVAGYEVAKAVLLRADDGYVLAVLPAPRSVDTYRVRKILGAESVELATEADCGHEFLDCEYGARVPFGSQYGLKTLLDETLMDDEEIVFEGNTHEESFRMKLDDYRSLEDPLVVRISHPF